MTNKELFRLFSEKYAQLLPFSLHYNWWNEVVKEQWDVAVVGDKNNLKAIWPYYIRKRGIWKMIANPHFTPYTGPFLIYPEGQKADTKVSYENKVVEDLIHQLPDFSELAQNFNLEFKNSLPFHWNGFTDEKRFTYVLKLVQDEEKIWNGFRENTRREIRKAEKTLSVVESNDAKLLEQLLKESYQHQSTAYPDFPSQLFKDLLDYTRKYKLGRMLIAKDAKDQIHAAMLCVYDHFSAYYLIGGAASDYKNSAAMSLLMWESIKAAKQLKLQQFNFEGSSIKSIEKYLRGFGGELTPFSRIQKGNSTSLGLLKKLK